MMSRKALLLSVLSLLAACCPSPAAKRDSAETKLAPVPDVTLATDDEKTLYIIGIAMGRSTTSLEVTPEELRFIEAGIEDLVAGRPARVSVETYAPKVEELHKRRTAAAIAKREAEGKAAIEAAAKEPGAVKTESGMAFRTLKPGTGGSPTATDKVKMHYRGTFPNGKLFDSSMEGDPVELVVAGVIPCWAEALRRMKVGEAAKLVCPPSLAYGDHGNPPTLPGHATLIFELELVSFEPAIDKTKADPRIPEDLRAP
jgi:FKBP-type peptidyl-prolyl cis-trans isomerase FkpA